MRTNVAIASPPRTTHEGGHAVYQRPGIELERAVGTCLLWENTFYETGNDLAARIAGLIVQVPAEKVAALAVKARNDWKLRHVPLWLVVHLWRAPGGTPALIRETIAAVVQRPDEAGELVSLYWKVNGRGMLPKSMKRGLAAAFARWKDYHLAKWNRDATVKLRDVLFLIHAKPKDETQAALWKALIDDTLPAPDTWEVALSAGTDKKATWERLLTDRKLGYMALLQNLRNMAAAGVETSLIESALRSGAATSKALPFRFITAARHAPWLAAVLSDAMVTALGEAPKLGGTTALLVDVSGSMDHATISAKSELTRTEAACALAILIREVCASVRVFSFSNQVVEIPVYRGLALSDAINRSQPHSGTPIAAALDAVKRVVPTLDRLIVVTDEQSQDGIRPSWATHGYLLNVAPYQPGLATGGGWTRINGWSERVVDWIRRAEALAS